MKLSDNDELIDNAAGMIRLKAINFFLRKRSATNMQVKNPKAMPVVAEETTKLLSVLLTLKKLEISGSKDW